MTVETGTGMQLIDLTADVAHFTRHVVTQPPHAPALKCAREAAEFAENPSIGEAADVLITVLGWIGLNGYGVADLLGVAEEKMRVNLARTWIEQADGTWQHVETGQ